MKTSEWQDVINGRLYLRQDDRSIGAEDCHGSGSNRPGRRRS